MSTTYNDTTHLELYLAIQLLVEATFKKKYDTIEHRRLAHG